MTAKEYLQQAYRLDEMINSNLKELDRLKAAELIGKRYSLFTDKVNVEGTQKVVVVDDLDE